MAEAAAYLSPAVFLGFAAVRLTLSAGARRDPVQRCVCGFALCTGLALLINAPPTLAALDGAVPVEPAVWLSRALKLLALTALAQLAVVLRRPGTPGRRPRQLRLGWAVQAATVLLFLAARPEITPDAVVAGDGRWYYAAYNALFIGYGCACLALLLRALLGHARAVGPGPHRAGLRLLATAAGVGVFWTGWGLTDLAAVLGTGEQPRGEHPVAVALGIAVAAVTLAGTTATVWGGPLSAPVRWLRARRRYRALEPLWRALHQAVPEIALPARPARGNPDLRDAEFALYRRIIEIRDGHLALRPYFHPEVPAWLAAARGGTDPATPRGPAAPDGSAAHVPGPDGSAEEADDPVLEAAQLAAALEHRGAGRPRYRGRPAPHTPRTARDLVDAEASWLLAVTEAFTRSPAVAEVRRRARATRRTLSDPA